MRLRRKNRPSLRGSVTQNKPTVRLDSRDDADQLSMGARLGLVAGSLILLLGITVWLWSIGWPQRLAEHAQNAALTLTQKADFAIADIQVTGRQHTAKDQIMSALGTSAGAPILAFDPVVAEERIAKLPWVGSVIVERRLPDLIAVHLTERLPLARWQHDGRTVVVDDDGKELPEAAPEQFANLPLVVGAGAASVAKVLVATLKDYPVVADKMTAAVWVGLRRWDIYLPPKITVRLPEGGLSDGLKRLATLITDQNILERNIVSIDLRFGDRIIMEQAGSASAPGSGETHL